MILEVRNCGKFKREIRQVWDWICNKKIKYKYMFSSIFKLIAENSDELKNVFVKTSQDCKAFLCLNETNYSHEDYCPYHQRCLSKLREKENISNSDIRRLETFETWFNGNCGYVIIERNTSFSIWLVIFEPSIHSMSENLLVSKYNTSLNNLVIVKQVTKQLKVKLQNNDFHVTPLLDICKFSDKYINFDEMLLNSDIIKKGLPHSHEPGFWSDRFWAPSNAENYLKPLDIGIGRRHFLGTPFYHVGIYLGRGNEGKNWICHLDNDKGVKITDWRSFLEAGCCEELIRFHPLIPFKNYSNKGYNTTQNYYITICCYIVIH